MLHKAISSVVKFHGYLQSRIGECLQQGKIIFIRHVLEIAALKTRPDVCDCVTHRVTNKGVCMFQIPGSGTIR